MCLWYKAFWRLWEIPLRRCEDRRFDRPGSSTSGAAYFPTQVTINDTESYQIETLVLPPPVFKDGSPYAVQQGAGMVVVKSDEKREYASVEFLKWFTDAQRNLQFSTESGYLPVKKEPTA